MFFRGAFWRVTPLIFLISGVPPPLAIYGSQRLDAASNSEPGRSGRPKSQRGGGGGAFLREGGVDAGMYQAAPLPFRATAGRAATVTSVTRGPPQPGREA